MISKHDPIPVSEFNYYTNKYETKYLEIPFTTNNGDIETEVSCNSQLAADKFQDLWDKDYEKSHSSRTDYRGCPLQKYEDNNFKVVCCSPYENYLKNFIHDIKIISAEIDRNNNDIPVFTW